MVLANHKNEVVDQISTVFTFCTVIQNATCLFLKSLCFLLTEVTGTFSSIFHNSVPLLETGHGIGDFPLSQKISKSVKH